MKLKIREFAKLTGVSVRTLQFYDEIGLLKLSSVDEQNGYRFYDEYALTRMQEILFYRKLDFPLKEIRMILSSPDYDKQNALKEQKHLLMLKKERLERIISALDIAMKGESIWYYHMSLSCFRQAHRHRLCGFLLEKTAERGDVNISSVSCIQNQKCNFIIVNFCKQTVITE